MLRIGEFSKLAKTTVKTLRFYDEIKLFTPSFVDDNGYRYYSIDQLGDLQKIVSLRAVNMPIDEIKEILGGRNAAETLQRHLGELERERLRIGKSISLIKKYLAHAEKGDFMKSYKAQEIIIPECTVFFRHGTIETMKDLVPFILEAGEEAAKNNPGLKCVEPDYCFVTYEAGEYRETDIELEFSQAVEHAGNPSENIGFKKLKEQRAVSVLHKGSYATLGEAYAYSLNYVKEKGYEIADSIRERYINGCWDREDEEDYLTEIQIPVR